MNHYPLEWTIILSTEEKVNDRVRFSLNFYLTFALNLASLFSLGFTSGVLETLALRFALSVLGLHFT